MVGDDSLIELGDNRFGAEVIRFAVIPIFQSYIEVARIRRGTAGVGHDIFDAGNLACFFGSGVDGLDGLVQGRPFGHGDTGHEHALVFVGDKRRRQDLVADAHKARDQDEEDGGIFQMTDHPADFPRVAVLEMIESPVEPAEEGTQRPGLDGLIIGLQENTA